VTTKPIRRYQAALENAIAGRLAARRRALGLTQAVLARRLGVSRVTVHNWETGAYYPASFVQFQAWARALGETLEIALR